MFYLSKQASRGGSPVTFWVWERKTREGGVSESLPRGQGATWMSDEQFLEQCRTLPGYVKAMLNEQTGLIDVSFTRRRSEGTGRTC